MMSGVEEFHCSYMYHTAGNFSKVKFGGFAEFGIDHQINNNYYMCWFALKVAN